MIRRVTPADRPALVALALAEDAAWSDASPVSAEEVGEFIDSSELGVIYERDGRVAGYARRPRPRHGPAGSRSRAIGPARMMRPFMR